MQIGRRSSISDAQTWQPATFQRAVRPLDQRHEREDLYILLDVVPDADDHQRVQLSPLGGQHSGALLPACVHHHTARAG